MNVWDAYEDRMTSQGDTRREMALRRGARTLNLKTPDSLSYQFVTMYDRDHGYNIQSAEMAAAAVERKVAIINSDNLDQKYIYALPGEDIELGSLVHWMDNYWLVEERDANTTLYTRAKMIQCNFLLHWVSDDKEICEQWCIIEDGTKLTCSPHDSLAYGKLYAITTPLIAGNSLEPYRQNGEANSFRRTAKNDMDWTISSQAANSGRFNDYPGSGSRNKRSEMGSPKPHLICVAW